MIWISRIDIEEILLKSVFQFKMFFVFILQVVMGVCKVYSFWPSVLFSSIFGVFLVIIEFIGPLIILIYCYGRIVWVLTRRIDSNLQPTSSKTDTFQLARTNTLKTFFLISICFVICWSCEQRFYFMFNIGYNVDFNGTFFKFSILMAFINCTINPFIYLLKYKDYQQALKHCLNCTRNTSSNADVKGGTISNSTMSMSVTTSHNSNLWSIRLFLKLGMQYNFSLIGCSWSHLSVCFWLFTPKFCEVAGTNKWYLAAI